MACHMRALYRVSRERENGLKVDCAVIKRAMTVTTARQNTIRAVTSTLSAGGQVHRVAAEIPAVHAPGVQNLPTLLRGCGADRLPFREAMDFGFADERCGGVRIIHG